MVEMYLTERHTCSCTCCDVVSPQHSCVAELFVLALPFRLLRFLNGQSSFQV